MTAAYFNTPDPWYCNSGSEMSKEEWIKTVWPDHMSNPESAKFKTEEINRMTMEINKLKERISELNSKVVETQIIASYWRDLASKLPWEE